MYRLEHKDLQNNTTNLETEFLLTNGIGGYASTTVTGRHTRKYHGLLIASLNPPVERFMTVSKMVETVRLENREVCLNHFDSKILNNSESDCLNRFEKNAGATWQYVLPDGTTLSKSLYLVQGENTAVLAYEVYSPKAGTLGLRPELSIRDHHDVSLKNDPCPTWDYKQTIAVHIQSERLAAGLKMKLVPNLSVDEPTLINALTLKPINQWVGPYYLANEAERGLQEETMAYVPFEWEIKLTPKTMQRFYIVITAEAEFPKESPNELIQMAETHQEELLKIGESQGLGLSPELKAIQETLQLAAADFIVKRQSTGTATILAGYPWFTDWGRDSMISLPGLTLSAGRQEVFRNIYETFERYMKNGILPNVFPDLGDEPRYNTVDATLWMSVAMLRYFEETQDLDYVKAHFLPALTSIIEHYQNGTLNNTYMDEDGLIWSGDASTQLTWMDVKVNGWVVTPRHGKAVEINVLWYNTLKIGQYFSELILKDSAALETEIIKSNSAKWESQSIKVATSFHKNFWNESLGYLNDVVRGDEVLSPIRPNQIFAISLPFPLLAGEQAQKVFKVVTNHLWMPYGLRSLSPLDPEYHGYYGGNVLSRDGAYHRGTGWGWLIGPYLDALLYIRRSSEADVSSETTCETTNETTNETTEETLNEIENILLKAGSHLSEICLGQYSENFDGAPPHHGRGCMAQAWSVAELLRWTGKINAMRLRRQLK